MHRRPHLPSADLPLDNLTRRQAAVFEHMAGRAIIGLRTRIDDANATRDPSRQPRPSDYARAEARQDVRDLGAEMTETCRLLERLRGRRTVPLTAEEEARLAAARAVREITPEEADAIIYGTLAVEAIEPDHCGILQEAAE